MKKNSSFDDPNLNETKLFNSSETNNDLQNQTKNSYNKDDELWRSKTFSNLFKQSKKRSSMYKMR